MATQIPAFMLNAMAINFGSILSFGDAEVQKVFQKLEVAGLRTFLGQSSQDIYPKELQDFYSSGVIDSEGNIKSTINDQLLIISEDSLGDLFHLPSENMSGTVTVLSSHVRKLSDKIEEFDKKGEEQKNS